MTRPVVWLAWKRAAAWAWACWALAQGAAVGQDSWSREQYTSENGLLQNRVHAIELDPWGGILIGTEGGLVRFDGENFKQIGIPAPEGLLPSRVLEIMPVPGPAYVIRDAGSRLFLYKDNVLTPITADAPARKPLSRFAGTGPSVDIVVQALDPDSTLDGKSEWPYGVRMVDLGRGRWCVRTADQILVYQGRALADRVPTPTGKWSHLFSMHGHLYIIDAVGAVLRVNLEDHSVRRVHTSGFPPAVMHDGQLNWRINWDPFKGVVTMITSLGLYVLDVEGDLMRAVRIPVELPTDCRMGSLAWLNNGQTLAVGSDTKGLFVYRRNTMRSLACDMMGDGVNNAYFAQAPYGPDAVITSTRGIVRMFTPAGCDDRQPPIRAFEESAIILDQKGHYWYGRSDTLFTLNASTGEENMVQPGLRALCFLEDGDAMVIGTAKGIYRSSGGKTLRLVALNDKDLSMRPIALCNTPGGELWIATCSGVFKLLPDGHLSPIPGLEGICARALAVVDEGVFVGTYGSGAFLFKGGKLVHLPMDQDGFLTHVHAFMPDQAGFLWMSTNQGLFRVNRGDLDRWTADPSQSVYMAYYGRKAGINNSEFNGGCSPAFVRTGDGWASFPTMDGLVWFRPEQVPDAYPLAPLVLEGLSVDGSRLPLGDEIVIPWDHREVSVTFSLAYWGTPENVKLEYSLDGGQEARWTMIRPGQRELHFSTLASGQNILRIRKMGAPLRGEGDAIALRFHVPVPFYRTSWFIASSAAALALFFWLALRLNAARLHRRNLQLEKMVRARTSELMSSNAELRKSLEMKEMLVSIISHDIVTPLRFIARVSNGAASGVQAQDPKRLGETLHDIASSSDKLYANAQGLLHWIKRQDGRIELKIRNVAAQPLVQEVLNMEYERATGKGLELVNEVPLDDVLHTDRNVLSIILHNLVANAVTHTAGGHVRVKGAQQRANYLIEIEDTGSGMPEAALRHAMRLQGRGALGAMNEEGERDVQGLGLLIVADLLHLLGGSFNVHSTKGQGTTVYVTIPMQPHAPLAAGPQHREKSPTLS
ncbi:MAG TPA: ATP-binding protein [Flavobacteriales bacterium]|mgnify:CR=1 FL=1|nr:ATP-binding protein [Flavobacteriales bacterium]